MTEKGTPGNFTYLFPEWIMSQALSTSVKDQPSSLGQIHIHSNSKTLTLREMFEDISGLNFEFEKPFEKGDFKKYGVDEEIYRTQFWSLRPDFTVESEKSNVLVLFEAKGGSYVPSSTWKDPKEKKYFEFLKQAKNYRKKGFFYFVPKMYENECKNCLEKFFSSEPNITIGYGIWEEMLDLLFNAINSTFSEWLYYQTKGIGILCEWKKEKFQKQELP